MTGPGTPPGLRGQTAVVTGAARRRGLGFAIATRLAAEGARVVLSDLGRLADELGDRVAELQARGASAMAVCADITSEQEVDGLFARALEETGRLDILVNNAGIIVTKLVTDTSRAEWQRCVDVMGLGTFLCAREAVKIMARQGTGGRIVNISSISGKRGNPYFGAYTFAKFGIIGFTQTLAREVAHLGITVNAVCPGTVETDMIDEVRADRAVHGRPEVPPWAEPIPMDRLASAEDVAAVVAFLASTDAAYLTGQALNVDGGRVTD